MSAAKSGVRTALVAVNVAAAAIFAVFAIGAVQTMRTTCTETGFLACLGHALALRVAPGFAILLFPYALVHLGLAFAHLRPTAGRLHFQAVLAMAQIGLLVLAAPFANLPGPLDWLAGFAVAGAIALPFSIAFLFLAKLPRSKQSYLALAGPRGRPA